MTNWVGSPIPTADLRLAGQGTPRADLLILDARSMTEVARIRLPSRVPYGVHACWLDASKIASLGR
jgi:hypothetical protein